MSRKWLITLVIIGLLFLGGNVLVWAMTPTTVAAQCGSNPPPDSSCFACHVQDDPVSGDGMAYTQIKIVAPNVMEEIARLWIKI